MRNSYHIVLLPGDGIGPEVVDSAHQILQCCANRYGLELSFAAHDFGGAGINAFGNPLPDKTLKACKGADAILLGATGHPQFDGLDDNLRPETGLLSLRAALGVFANLRPVAVAASLAHLSALPAEKAAGVDILVVRELTGGIYFGSPRQKTPDLAFDTMLYTRPEIERITRVACSWARRRSGRITSVDKANVLAVSQLWRETASRIVADEYPDIKLNHLYVDNAAMQMILDPHQFDVLLTGNLFGDILSDLASTLAGSLGLLPSASLGGMTPLFEPVHGSAPDIAGKGLANPVGAILSAAMMLDEWGIRAAADEIRSAVTATLAAGIRTADLVPDSEPYHTTSSFTDAVLQQLTITEPVR